MSATNPFPTVSRRWTVALKGKLKQLWSVKHNTLVWLVLKKVDSSIKLCKIPTQIILHYNCAEWGVCAHKLNYMVYVYKENIYLFQIAITQLEISHISFIISFNNDIYLVYLSFISELVMGVHYPLVPPFRLIELRSSRCHNLNWKAWPMFRILTNPIFQTKYFTTLFF